MMLVLALQPRPFLAMTLGLKVGLLQLALTVEDICDTVSH